MKKNKNNNEQQPRNNKFLNLLSGIIVGMFTCITLYLIYNIFKLSGIEDLIRYIVIGVLALICVIVLIKYLRFRKKGKVSKYLMFILVLLIIGTGEFFISSIINKGVSVIDNMNKNEVTYESALISLKDGNYDTLKKVKEGKIGIITDTDDVEGYVLAQEIIKKDKISKDNLIEYDDYITMLTDLYAEEVNAVFVSGGYVDKFASVEKFSNIADKVKVIDSYSKRMKKVIDKSTEVSTKKVTEPFTLLLLGVDSDEENLSKASGLGDSIMLITFNPKTLNATMFSIPRDTYVQITCYRNALSKITHAASGGDSCMINTVEKFTGIDIDYYAKINFRGLINLVDALGGIDVEVPYAFCESNWHRSLALEHLIYVEKGWQHLNGVQALALSRNRKTIPRCGAKWNQGTRNDFVRGKNQQIVIKGIMNKLKNIRSINQLYSVLDTISKSLDTNLSREQILDFYNVFKKVLINSNSLSDSNDIISIQKTYLNGSGGLIHDNIMNMKLYEFVPSNQSLNAIIKAMKINLELIDEEYETSFSFSIDEEYKEKIIGSDLYGGVTRYPDVEEDEEPKDEKVCEENEELGADKTSCVCKYGYKRNSKTGECEKEEEKTCEENEELGADGITCVCKNGYSKNESGVCEKKNIICGENEEFGADGVTCLCKPGYEKNSSGVCVLSSSGSETEGGSQGGTNTDSEDNTTPDADTPTNTTENGTE